MSKQKCFWTWTRENFDGPLRWNIFQRRRITNNFNNSLRKIYQERSPEQWRTSQVLLWVKRTGTANSWNTGFLFYIMKQHLCKHLISLFVPWGLKNRNLTIHGITEEADRAQASLPARGRDFLLHVTCLFGSCALFFLTRLLLSIKIHVMNINLS